MRKLILILSMVVFGFANCSDDKRACYKIVITRGDYYYYTNSYTTSNGCITTEQGEIICGCYTIMNNKFYMEK